MYKATEKTSTGTIQLVEWNPSLRKPPNLKLLWKDVIYNLFKARLFTVAAKFGASRDLNELFGSSQPC